MIVINIVQLLTWWSRFQLKEEREKKEEAERQQVMFTVTCALPCYHGKMILTKPSLPKTYFCFAGGSRQEKKSSGRTSWSTQGLPIRSREIYSKQTSFKVVPFETGVTAVMYKYINYIQILYHNLQSYIYTCFFYKNFEAEICQNFKNMLRTYPGWESVRTALFCSFVFVALWTSVFNAFCEARFTKSWVARHLVRGIRASRTSMWQATWGFLVNSALNYWNLKNVFRLKSPKDKNVQPQFSFYLSSWLVVAEKCILLKRKLNYWFDLMVTRDADTADLALQTSKKKMKISGGFKDFSSWWRKLTGNRLRKMMVPWKLWLPDLRLGNVGFCHLFKLKIWNNGISVVSGPFAKCSPREYHLV